MRASTFVLFGFIVASTLAGCSEEPELPAQLTQKELPMAPVLPTYENLVSVAPPEPKVEVPQPLTDLQHQAWRPGYWASEGGQFNWVPGKVIAKPAFTAVWVPDHWEQHEYGWTFACGHWQ